MVKVVTEAGIPVKYGNNPAELSGARHEMDKCLQRLGAFELQLVWCEGGHVVSELLHSIKVIKMFAWERPLADRIAKDRAHEVDRLKRYGYMSSVQSIFWNSAPVTVSMATFGAYAAMGNTLDMHIVIPALAIINIMSFPLFVFPLLISAVIRRPR